MTLPTSGFLSARVMPLEAVTGRFAVLGICHGIPYSTANLSASVCNAPHAIRERSARFGRMRTHYDFDLGRPLDADGTLSLVDCGDVPAQLNDIRGSAARATAA